MASWQASNVFFLGGGTRGTQTTEQSNKKAQKPTSGKERNEMKVDNGLRALRPNPKRASNFPLGLWRNSS